MKKVCKGNRLTILVCFVALMVWSGCGEPEVDNQEPTLNQEEGDGEEGDGEEGDGEEQEDQCDLSGLTGLEGLELVITETQFGWSLLAESGG